MVEPSRPDYGTAAAHALGWPVFDRRAITATLAAKLEELGLQRKQGWMDNAHLAGFPNQEINNALYNLLCGQ
jgi:hypothetical protein